MKPYAAAVAALTFGVLACQDAGPPLAPAARPAASTVAPDVIPGSYIVVFHDHVADVETRARELAETSGGILGFTYTHALKGFSVSGISELAAAALAADPSVDFVQQNRVIRLVATQTDATWGLDRVDQRDLPLSTIYVYNATGAGVTAYILDTGIRFSHADFGGRAVFGYDAINDGQNGADCNGHGTHVAGTVGGATWGIAKGVTLVAVRVLDCGGSGTTSGVIAGVDWVTGHHQTGQPAVANMSLGGGADPALDNAVAQSVSDGVTYAVAAGNGYANACDGSPAREASAITVGATDKTDREASFSDRGGCLDIWAPGVDIISAWHTSDNAVDTLGGTSMASPHVAGAAALYLEGNPGASAAEVDQALSENATTGKITWNNPFGLKPPPPPAGQDYLLYTGFINGEPPPPPPPPPLPPLPPLDLLANTVSHAQIDLTWADASDNESNFEIERCTGVGCTNFARIATVGANVTTYQNTGLSASTTYTYRVRATNAGGPSDYSNESAATTLAPPPVPAAPSSLTATAVSPTQIDLTWADNSDNESGFRIERCTGSSCTNFAEIATVGANVTSYQNTGLSASTTYRYRVRAYNANGNSGYSNVASATTPCATRGGSGKCR